jgi:putative FmdB family regulatory protein
MPTYDYRCEACEHAFEEFQSMSAKPLRKCPACGKLKLKRLIGTGAGVIFKGSGFYETDYRSEGYQKAMKAESDAAKPKQDGGTKDAGGSADKSGSASPAKPGNPPGGKPASDASAKPKPKTGA